MFTINKHSHLKLKITYINFISAFKIFIREAKVFVVGQHVSITSFGLPLAFVQHQLLYTTSFGLALAFVQHQLLSSTSFFPALAFVQHQLLSSTSFCPALAFVQHQLWSITSFGLSLAFVQHQLLASTSCTEWIQFRLKRGQMQHAVPSNISQGCKYKHSSLLFKNANDIKISLEWKGSFSL